jgi:hypothetical protein
MIDLAENRFNSTESRFVACLNRLLQQNLPEAEISNLTQIVAVELWLLLSRSMLLEMLSTRPPNLGYQRRLHPKSARDNGGVPRQ